MTLYSLCVGARYVVPSCQLTTLGLLAGHCAGMRWCVQLCRNGGPSSGRVE